MIRVKHIQSEYDEFAKQVNEALAEIEQHGELREIHYRYQYNEYNGRHYHTALIEYRLKNGRRTDHGDPHDYVGEP